MWYIFYKIVKQHESKITLSKVNQSCNINKKTKIFFNSVKNYKKYNFSGEIFSEGWCYCNFAVADFKSFDIVMDNFVATS